MGYIKETGLKIDAKTARGRANQLKGHLDKIARKYEFEEAEVYEDGHRLGVWIVSWEGGPNGWADVTQENIFGAYDGLDYELYCDAKDALKRVRGVSKILTTYPSNGFAWDLTQNTFDWVGIEAGIDYDAEASYALAFYPSN